MFYVIENVPVALLCRDLMKYFKMTLVGINYCSANYVERLLLKLCEARPAPFALQD